MDSGSLDRVSRTLVTFWAYITEVVGGFFRTEPANIADPNRVGIEHVYDRETGISEDYDGRKAGGDDLQSDVSTASVVCTSRPVVALQQWCVDVRPEPDAEREYTQEATRGGESQVQQRLSDVATPITKQFHQSDDVRDGVVCEDAIRRADVPDLMDEKEHKSQRSKPKSRRNLQLCEEEEVDEEMPEDGAAGMDVWTEEGTLGNAVWSLVSDEPTTDKTEGEEEGDGSVVDENTNKYHIDEGEVPQKSENVKEGQFMSKPITDGRHLDMNMNKHSIACSGEVLEIKIKTIEEDIAVCSNKSGKIHETGINKSETKESEHSLEEEILVTHPITLTIKTEYNNGGEMNAELNSVFLRQHIGSVWSQELICLADEESQEGVPECNNGRDTATAQTLLQQGHSGEIDTAHLPEEVDWIDAECVETGQKQEGLEVKTSSDKECHWDMVLERQARVTLALPGETETSMNETAVDQSDKAVVLESLDCGQGVIIDETLYRLNCLKEGKALADSALWESEAGEAVGVDVGQTNVLTGEETVMFTVSPFVPASEPGEPMDVNVPEDDDSSLLEEDEGIKNCFEPQIRTDKPDSGIDAEDVTSTNDNGKETVNLLTTGTSHPLSKNTDGRNNSSITQSEYLTSIDFDLPGELGNMNSDVSDQPQQDGDDELNAEPNQQSVQIKSKPEETVTVARDMVIHNVMEPISSFTTPGLAENVSGQTTETDEEILDMWIETVLEGNTEPEERELELAGLQADWETHGQREQLPESHSMECVLEVCTSTMFGFSGQALSEESLADSKDQLMTVPGSAQDIKETEDTPTEPARTLTLSANLDIHDKMETVTVSTGHSHTKDSPAETLEPRCNELKTENESTQDQGKLTDGHFSHPQDAKEPFGVPMEGADIKSEMRTSAILQNAEAVVEMKTDSGIQFDLGSESINYQDFTVSPLEQLMMVNDMDGPQTPSGISFQAGNLLTFNTSGLDFTPQKWRISVKNSHIRPPKDPRKLLHMPSVDPSPPKSSSQSPMKAGVRLGGLGVGIKLPGLGAGLPVLKKTPMQTITDTAEHGSKMPVRQSEVKEGSSPKAEHTPKWVPPARPGFGVPLMSELKNKLKKADE